MSVPPSSLGAGCDAVRTLDCCRNVHHCPSYFDTLSNPFSQHSLTLCPLPSAKGSPYLYGPDVPLVTGTICSVTPGEAGWPLNDCVAPLLADMGAVVNNSSGSEQGRSIIATFRK